MNSLEQLKNSENAYDVINNKNINLITSLCSSIPIVPAAQTYYQDIAQDNLNQKLKIVEDEILNNTRFIVTSELEGINIFKYFNRMKQTIERTNVNEKIHYAARLFVFGFLSDNPLPIDLYENYFNILDDLSLCEIAILSILYSIEKNPNPYLNSEIDEQERIEFRYWSAFEAKVFEELEIPQPQIYPMMKRLERTGFFTLFNGFSFGAIEAGETTASFHQFYKYIIEFTSEKGSGR